MPEYYYINDRKFPANVAYGEPHLLQIVHEPDDPGERIIPHLCDWITTMIYGIKDHPTVMDWFFDPNVRTIRLAPHSNNTEAEARGSFVVRRYKDQVLVSLNPTSPYP